MSADGPRLLHDLTWPAIADLVDAGEELIVLPVGATEQHGRHLPASTDTTIATALCEAASARTGVPVLPPLAISSSQAHTAAWPGTFSLPPRLFVDVVIEIARWARASGFTKLLIVNAHVGNVAPLKVAIDDLRLAGELRVGAVNWWELTPEIQATVSADAADWHANAAETSLMLHLRSELVVDSEIRDDPDRTGELVFSYTVAETSADGLTGKPSTASAEAGRLLFEETVTALAERLERARAELPPSLEPQNEETQ